MTAKATATRVKGTKKKITMDGDFPEVEPMELNEKKSGTISVQEFIDKLIQMI